MGFPNIQVIWPAITACASREGTTEIIGSSPKATNEIDVRVSGSIISETGPVLLSGAISGLGIVVLQEYMVRPAIAEGSLQTHFV